MRFGLMAVLTVFWVGVSGPACARANGPASESFLSLVDRTTIAAILDALALTNGDTLVRTVVSALDTPGIDPQSVTRSVKTAAGSNLAKFQSILVRTCLDGGKMYCKLAAVQAPESQDSDVATAATDSEDGAGGSGGGFGGTPQMSDGRYMGVGSGGSLFRTAGSDQNFQNFGQSFGSHDGSGGVGGPTAAGPSTPVVSTPSPVAGAGLPSALAALVWSIWRWRRQSKKTT